MHRHCVLTVVPLLSVLCGCSAFVPSNIQRTLPQRTTRASKQTCTRLTAQDDVYERWWITLQGYGVRRQTALLSLYTNNTCLLSNGIPSRELGEWRIAEEDGAPFIEFTHILPELMQQLLEIDEDNSLWRGLIYDGKIEQGAVVSFRKKWFGFQRKLTREGLFSARLLGATEKLPEVDEFDLMDTIPPADANSESGLAKYFPEELIEYVKKAEQAKLTQRPIPPFPEEYINYKPRKQSEAGFERRRKERK